MNEDNIQQELDDFLKEEITNINFPIYKSDSTKNKNDKTILILSGGAIKGIAHIGVLKALEIKNMIQHIHTYVGTSVGGMILALYILGYKADELYEIVKHLEMNKVKSITFANLLEYYGLDNGNKIEYVLKRLITAKNFNENITLKELYNKTKKTLILTTVCLNDMKAYYLSHETEPDLSLCKAIRMTISIPIYYTPVRHKNNYYVDGGCIDNYPIHIFNENIEQVIGAFLEEPRELIDTIDNLETCVMSMINCLMQGVNYNSTKGYEKYTISITLDKVNPINYKITINEKKKMFNVGFNETLKYINKI